MQSMNISRNILSDTRYEWLQWLDNHDVDTIHNLQFCYWSPLKYVYICVYYSCNWIGDLVCY